jgi:excisionase family DNA binding protein
LCNAIYGKEAYRILETSYGILCHIVCVGVTVMLKRSFYSPEEVAEYFGVSVETIRRMCREGQIPGLKKIGRQYRIPASFLEQTSSIQETDEDTKDQQK